MDVNKVVIPAAGLGTRFLPATKAVPKEMMPILDKPAIQYIIEEALLSHVKQFFMITSRGKAAIADHFDFNPCLEEILKERGKESLLKNLNTILRSAFFTYIRQSEQLGLGHAIAMARHSIGKEYFGVCLPDDIIINKSNPGLAQLIKVARQEKASVIAVQEVPMDSISSYGVITIKKQITPNLYQVAHLVEKPDPKDAPSNLAVIGRYVLSHKIFDAIDEITPYSSGEIQLTDAIVNMMSNNEKVIAYKIQGQRFDIGNPVGWLKANIGLAVNNKAYSSEINKLFEDTSLLEALAGTISSIASKTK